MEDVHVHLDIMFSSQPIRARADKHYSRIIFSWEWMLIVSFPTEDKSQMLEWDFNLNFVSNWMMFTSSKQQMKLVFR